MLGSLNRSEPTQRLTWVQFLFSIWTLSSLWQIGSAFGEPGRQFSLDEMMHEMVIEKLRTIVAIERFFWPLAGWT